MITLFTGTMYAGKSRQLIATYKSRAWRLRTCLVPELDEGAHGHAAIDGRGQAIQAREVKKDEEDEIEFPSEGDIYIDEVQFFSPAFVRRIAVHQAANPDVDFFIGGLSLDSKGRPWQTTAEMAMYADQVVRLHSACAICGGDAFFSVCTHEADPFMRSTFEPRCRMHALGVSHV